MPKDRPIKISLLATRDSATSTLYGLYDVLSSVGVAWEDYVTGGQFVPKFDVRIVAATSEPFRCAGNHIISPHAGIDDAKDTDIALVASFVIPNKPPLKIRYDRELDWVCHQQERGSFIAAACSGSILLADAGLLDGWEATSHWAFRDIFITTTRR